MQFDPRVHDIFLYNECIGCAEPTWARAQSSLIFAGSFLE
jgi:hypothetical protein